jgi:hypothetical protein
MLSNDHNDIASRIHARLSEKFLGYTERESHSGQAGGGLEQDRARAEQEAARKAEAPAITPPPFLPTPPPPSS